MIRQNAGPLELHHLHKLHKPHPLGSRTHEHLVRNQRLGINILSREQAAVAHRFARSGGDKFAGVDLSLDKWVFPCWRMSAPTSRSRSNGESRRGHTRSSWARSSPLT
ncbi:MAG: flavin reductase family protein, partial [Solirubrobacterales bacterium]|nr:flavin reductase family protein [Solirubrobacterales bacterium]